MKTEKSKVKREYHAGSIDAYFIAGLLVRDWLDSQIKS